MHCDTVSLLLKNKRRGKNFSLRKNTGHIDLIRMKNSGYNLQNFALFVDTGKCENPWAEFLALYECYNAELDKNTDLIARVNSFLDIEKNCSQGKMSALLTLEEGAVFGGDTKKLETLYNMGIRMITLTWNYPNELGFPNLDYSLPKTPKSDYSPNTQNGLTKRGREIVALMEKLGIIIDVSHLSDKGFYDVFECTKKPFVASHSNARSVCGHIRNLTDDMLKKLALRGGCAGLNFYPLFLADTPKNADNSDLLSAIVEHAKYMVNCAGIDIISLGSDFDGFNCRTKLKGAQSMPFLWEALHKSGFTENQLDKIFYKNALRVYKEILK